MYIPYIHTYIHIYIYICTGKNYDDECERRNFGDPVHEDDEMFNIYVYDWSQNTSNFQAILQVSSLHFQGYVMYYAYICVCACMGFCMNGEKEEEGGWMDGWMDG